MCRHCGGFCFAVIKVDSLTGRRLSGATFCLTSRNGCTASKTTNDNGVAYFCIKPCVPYQIIETGAPHGYQLNRRPITVFVDRCGRVYLNGRCTGSCCVVVPDCPDETHFCFTVKKIDAHTGAALPGATFDLLLNNRIVGTATSGQNRELTFRELLPGRYHLLESFSPPGYQNNATPYEVVITTAGEVTINGYPPREFAIPNIQGFHLSFQKVAVSCGDSSN